MEYRWKKNTAIFLISQAISLFGSSLVQYAITWHITLTTKSGVYATLAILCGFLPTFLLSPFAGVWADRYNRKILIVLADGGIALSTLVLAVLWMGGYQEIWLLLAVMAVRAFGSAIQQPCINAMLPSVVPNDQLTRVNGINGSLQSLIMLVSPMLSGALMGFASLSSIFFIDVMTAIAAIGVLIFLFQLPEKIIEENVRTAGGGYLSELKEGFTYILSTPFLRNFFAIAIVLWLMTGPIAFLTPLQVARNYGDDVWRLTAVEVAFSAGMLGGGLIISVWGGFKNRVHTIALAAIVMAIGSCVLGVAIPFWSYLIAMVVIGLMLPAYNTPAIVLLQEKVEPRYIGRVFGVMTMLSSSLLPVGMLAFGPLADYVPIEYLLVATGLVMATLAVIMMRNKPLLQAGLRIEGT